MNDDERQDGPVVSVFFSLEIEGTLQAVFSGLTLSSAVEPRSDVDPPTGRRIVPTVTLTRRHDTDTRLFAWHQTVVDGPVSVARKNCTLNVFDASGAQTARYLLDLAWPAKVEVA